MRRPRRGTAGRSAREGRRQAEFGFTLIELLVVAAILAVLLAMLVPILKRAKELGSRAVCISRLRTLVVAARAYATDHDGYLPLKCGSGVRYELCKTPWGGAVELRWKGYVEDIDTFRCPSLRGHSNWMGNFAGYFNIGYLGYQFDGLSTALLPGKTAQSANAPFVPAEYYGAYWVRLGRVPGDYVMVRDNLVDEDNAYRNYLEMNYTCHVRGDPQGGNLSFADGSARWFAFEPQGDDPTPVNVVDANWYGPFWDGYLPKAALIVKDDNEYSFVSGAARLFYWRTTTRGSEPLRGKVQPDAWLSPW